MIISFFEEYPTKENLNKLNLIKFPTKLYLAAPSLKKFKETTSKIKNKKIKEIIYWPILERKEGYWYSPFSKRAALKRTLDEIPLNQSVMIDLELPTSQNPKLYYTQFINFFRNRRLIRKFIKNHKKVYTAEYFPIKKWLKFLALNFDSKKYNNKVIKMLYTSMWPFSLENHLKQGKDLFKNNYIAGFGVIATGEGGNETCLTTKQLENDLTLAQKNKVKEIIIFRLGGLNKNYLKIISKFV
tara:strand:- start:17068 stop:17793 length:726 start_codon:yes stop_codon:yes gene_type:complete